MFQKLKRVWNKYGFEILVCFSVLCIFIIAIMRYGKKGSWESWKTWKTSQKYYVPEKKKRTPVRESKGEIECKRVLEEMFKKPFKKERPDFLRNPVTSEGHDINNLELDCYNDELKLAVEYNGIQHYKFVPFYHKNKESFHNQKYRDYMKRILCEKNKVKLIEVPYTVKIEDIKNYIHSKIRPVLN